MLLPELQETTLRLGVFALLLVLFSLAEWRWPRRVWQQGRRRWLAHLGLVALGSATVRLLALASPLLMAAGAAQAAAAQGWGLLHQVELGAVVEFGVALLLLDLMVWAQHRAFHRLPWLWHLHQVHHADRDLDASSAVRFHPGEILVSMLIKVGVVLVLGPSAAAVVVFEIVLNGCALFNHANLRLPRWLDATLRVWIVTPDMHRVHHSVLRAEQAHNFGFCLSAWDHLFATYQPQPRDGHEAMVIGLAEHQTESSARLGWCLRLPAMSLRSAPVQAP